MNRDKNLIFLILMTVSMFFWGVNWTTGKLLTEWTTPEVLAFWRYFFTIIFILPFFIKSKKEKLSLVFSKLPMLTVSGVLLALFNILFFKGLSSGSAAIGGIFFNTFSPVITMVITIVLLKQSIKPLKIIGIIVGLTGGVILILSKGSVGNELLKNGNLFFLSAAICWSAITLLSRRVQKTVPFFTYNVVVYTVAAIIHLIFAYKDPINIFEIKSIEFWLLLGFTSVGATAFASTMFFYATHKLSAYKASTFMFIIPISAFIAAHFILGEQLGFIEYLGGGLSVLALILVSVI